MMRRGVFCCGTVMQGPGWDWVGYTIKRAVGEGAAVQGKDKGFDWVKLKENCISSTYSINGSTLEIMTPLSTLFREESLESELWVE